MALLRALQDPLDLCDTDSVLDEAQMIAPDVFC
jgi:hypothetical protein